MPTIPFHGRRIDPHVDDPEWVETAATMAPALLIGIILGCLFVGSLAVVAVLRSLR